MILLSIISYIKIKLGPFFILFFFFFSLLFFLLFLPFFLLSILNVHAHVLIVYITSGFFIRFHCFIPIFSLSSFLFYLIIFFSFLIVVYYFSDIASFLNWPLIQIAIIIAHSINWKFRLIIEIYDIRRANLRGLQ